MESLVERSEQSGSADLLHPQLVGQHRQVDALVDAAVRLEDAQPRALEKEVLRVAQEKVVVEHRGTLLEPLLRVLKIGVREQVLQQPRDRIGVRRTLDANHAHEVTHLVAAAGVGDDGDGEVAQQMWRVHLQRLHVLLLRVTRQHVQRGGRSGAEGNGAGGRRRLENERCGDGGSVGSGEREE